MFGLLPPASISLRISADDPSSTNAHECSKAWCCSAVPNSSSSLSLPACRDDESSECATARQHKVAEVACYRTPRRHWRGAPTPLLRGSVHPISVLELANNEVVGGELTELSLARFSSISSSSQSSSSYPPATAAWPPSSCVATPPPNMVRRWSLANVRAVSEGGAGTGPVGHFNPPPPPPPPPPPLLLMLLLLLLLLLRCRLPLAVGRIRAVIGRLIGDMDEEDCDIFGRPTSTAAAAAAAAGCAERANTFLVPGWLAVLFLRLPLWRCLLP